MPDVLAAVDLGSNSFHMVVGRYSHGQITIVDRLRETVRLAAGLDDQDRLNRDATGRALACLERFGQRLHDMKAERVRVVGTNTLRKARRKGAFLDRAREALGHPIEIISGVEEARLIYLGVAHTTPSEGGHRLVIDIGGGSTELIIGEGFAARRLESLYMGCVSMTSALVRRRRHHREAVQAGAYGRRARVRARHGAVQEIRVGCGVRRLGHDALRRATCCWRAARRTATSRARAWTGWSQECLRAGNVTRLKLPGLAGDRQEILPGGLAIIVSAFHMLGIESMRVADGALREGLLYDLVGRLTDEDARARSVRSMEGRFHVDARRRTESRPRRSPSCARCARHGTCASRSPSSRCAGQRGCTKSASTSRMRNITGTAHTCCSTATCQASRGRSSGCSRCWSVGIAAS